MEWITKNAQNTKIVDLKPQFQELLLLAHSLWQRYKGEMVFINDSLYDLLPIYNWLVDFCIIQNGMKFDDNQQYLRDYQEFTSY